MSSFLKTFGSSFGTTKVVLIKDYGTPHEARTELECIMQSKKVDFAVDAPVYEGDYLEVPDPRAPDKPSIKYISAVEIFNTPKMANMAHITAKLTDAPPTKSTPAARIVNNTNIVVHGSGNQFAIGNITANQAQEIATATTGEYQPLANEVARILADLEPLSVDDDHREAVQSSAKALLDEISASEPDPTLIRRLGVFLKNAVAGAAYATGSGVSQAVTDFARTHVADLLALLPPV